MDDSREIFILGGALLFREALPFTKKIYMTIINKRYDCDQAFDLGYLNKYFTITKVTDKTGRLVTTADKSKDEFLFFEYDRVRV